MKGVFIRFIILLTFSVLTSRITAQIYTTVSSVSNFSPDTIITLQLVRDTNGSVIVNKLTSMTDSVETSKAFVLQDFHYPTMSLPNDSFMVEYPPLPTGYFVFWIPIDCNTNPIAMTGVGYKFWCDDCPNCGVKIISTSNSSVVSCNLTCCTLKKEKIEGTMLPNGAGVLFVAKSVFYTY
jgi:hypothetical protein